MASTTVTINAILDSVNRNTGVYTYHWEGYSEQIGAFDATTYRISSTSGSVKVTYSSNGWNGYVYLYLAPASASSSYTPWDEDDVAEFSKFSVGDSIGSKRVTLTGDYTLSRINDDGGGSGSGSSSTTTSPIGTNIPSAKFLNVRKNGSYFLAEFEGYARPDKTMAVAINGATCNANYQYYTLEWEVSKTAAANSWEKLNTVLTNLALKDENGNVYQDNTSFRYANITNWLADKYSSGNSKLIYTGDGVSFTEESGGFAMKYRDADGVPDGDLIFTPVFINSYNPANKLIYIRLCINCYAYNSSNSTNYKAYKLYKTYYSYVQTASNAYTYHAKLSIDTSLKPSIGTGVGETTYSPLSQIWFGIKETPNDDGTIETETIASLTEPSQDDGYTYTHYVFSSSQIGFAMPLLIDSRLSWVKEPTDEDFYYYYTKPRITVFAHSAEQNVALTSMTLTFNGANQVVQGEDLKQIDVTSMVNDEEVTTTYYYCTTIFNTPLLPQKNNATNSLNVNLIVTDEWGRSASSSDALTIEVNLPPELRILMDKSSAQRVRFVDDGASSFFTATSTGDYLRMAYLASVPDNEEFTGFPIAGNKATAQVEIQMISLDENGSPITAEPPIPFVQRLSPTTVCPLPLELGDATIPATMVVGYYCPGNENCVALGELEQNKGYTSANNPFFKLDSKHGYLLQVRVVDCARNDANQLGTPWVTIMSISKATPAVHFAGTGYGVGFGTFADDTSPQNPKFVNEFVTTMNIPSVVCQETSVLSASGVITSDGATADNRIRANWKNGDYSTLGVFNNYTIVAMRETDYRNYKTHLAQGQAPYGDDSNLIVFIVEQNPLANNAAQASVMSLNSDDDDYQGIIFNSEKPEEE